MTALKSQSLEYSKLAFNLELHTDVKVTANNLVKEDVMHL